MTGPPTCTQFRATHGATTSNATAANRSACHQPNRHTTHAPKKRTSHCALRAVEHEQPERAARKNRPPVDEEQHEREREQQCEGFDKHGDIVGDQWRVQRKHQARIPTGTRSGHPLRNERAEHGRARSRDHVHALCDPDSRPEHAHRARDNRGVQRRPDRGCVHELERQREDKASAARNGCAIWR
jgi:hypothetical protein